jgi:hypothetical protein
MTPFLERPKSAQSDASSAPKLAHHRRATAFCRENFLSQRAPGANIWGVVVIYARGLESNRLWDYAVRRGWSDGEGIRAISEPALLLSAIRSGRVEIILASNLNGLARSSCELVELLREFVSRKIALVVPGMGLDTSKVPKQAILDVLGAIEEFKHAATTQSVRAGLARARARGVRLGRPETVNVHREDVARLRAQGLSCRDISKELGVPSSSVFKIIGQLRV